MKRLFLFLILALASLSASAATGFQQMMAASSTSSAKVWWAGGIGEFAVDGTWNGATVTLEFALPDGTLLPAGANTTFTANGAGVFYLPACFIQAVVSSAGGSTSLTASVGNSQT